ncbi:MAG: rhomboid family intramembrane serine protease [Firmicutes bacterium]|nr:rhomboid family intramembrane serine protease [Bacillota bacterium]
MFPLRDNIPSFKRPFVTYTLIVTNTIIYLFQFLLPSRLEEMFVFKYGFVPIAFLKAIAEHRLTVQDFYPFLTSMFIHGNWTHLISNMWTLWLFGDNIEDRLGHFRFILFYLLSGFFAMFSHFIFYSNSFIPAIGASGAIAGVMGAYVILFPYSRIITFIPVLFVPLFVRIPALIYLAIWFLIQLYNGAVSSILGGRGSGVAWWAHIGGFISGILFLKLLYTRKYRRPVYYE